jgi:hypothetical protein
MDGNKIRKRVASTAFVILAIGAVAPFLSTWNDVARGMSEGRLVLVWLAGPYLGLMPAVVMSSRDRQASTVVLCGTLLTAGTMMLLTWAEAPTLQPPTIADGQVGGLAAFGFLTIILYASLGQWAGVFIVGLIARYSLPAENRPGTFRWVLAAPLTMLVTFLVVLWTWARWTSR